MASGTMPRPRSVISATLVTLLHLALAASPSLAGPNPPAGSASVELAFPFTPAASSAPQFTPDTLPDLPASSQPNAPANPEPSNPQPSNPQPSAPSLPDVPSAPSAPSAPAEPANPADPSPSEPALTPPDAAAVAPGTACPASDLDGYDFSAPLIPDKFLLHWRLNASSLDIAVEAKLSSQVDNGWMAVGWSIDGAMSPSDAVIGNLEGGAIRAFALSGYTADSVNATESIRLGNTGSTSTSSGSTVFWFSRSPGDGGSVPILLSGPNFIIWAYSRDMFQTLGYHSTHRGVAQVDFSCKQAPQVLMGEGSPGDEEEGGFTPENPGDPLGSGSNNQNGGSSSSSSGDGSQGNVVPVSGRPGGNQAGGALRKLWSALFPSLG